MHLIRTITMLSAGASTAHAYYNSFYQDTQDDLDAFFPRRGVGYYEQDGDWELERRDIGYASSFPLEDLSTNPRIAARGTEPHTPGSLTPRKGQIREEPDTQRTSVQPAKVAPTLHAGGATRTSGAHSGNVARATPLARAQVLVDNDREIRELIQVLVAHPEMRLGGRWETVYAAWKASFFQLLDQRRTLLGLPEDMYSPHNFDRVARPASPAEAIFGIYINSETGELACDVRPGTEYGWPAPPNEFASVRYLITRYLYPSMINISKHGPNFPGETWNLAD